MRVRPEYITDLAITMNEGIIIEDGPTSAAQRRFPYLLRIKTFTFSLLLKIPGQISYSIPQNIYLDRTCHLAIRLYASFPSHILLCYFDPTSFDQI